MKNVNRFSRVLSLIMVVAMLLTMMPASIFAVEDTNKIYLKPSSNWAKDGARFAIYAWWDSGNQWFDMTDSNSDGIYEAELPVSVSNIIFCRMNPSDAANDWNNKWNQTGDLKVQTNGNNCYTVKEGTWDQGGGTWSRIAEEFSVTYVLTNLSSSNTAATIEENTAYTTTLTAAEDYALPASVNVSVNGIVLTEGYAYDAATGNLNIDAAAVTGDIVITAEAVRGWITVYFQNNWLWSELSVYYWGGSESTAWPGDKMIFVENDGTYDIYSAKIPADVTGVVFNGKKNDGSGATDQTPDITGDAIVYDDKCYYMKWDNGNQVDTFDYTPPADGEGEEPVIPEPTYIIAGSGMFGTEWDPSNTANKMTLNADGLYEKVYTNVAAGTYEFKVTDGTWVNCWPNGNYALTVAEESNVTILFNAETKAIEVKQEPVAAKLSTDYYLVGYLNNADYSGNNYHFDESGKLTVKFNATSYVMIKNAAGKTYYFKTYCTAATGTLYGSGANEKMNVPGGLDLTFTLAENADGTLTLSYEVAEPETPANAEYYLVGYINGKDYGIEGDSANLGEYKFVDGKLSVKFTQDSYVVVKSDSNVMYCAQSYSTAKTVTLKAGYSEKLFVPGNVDLTFSLVTNADGTLTLSYESGTVTPPAETKYYLVGYLNNADYAGEDYVFVDGKLTVTFNADSYVYVKDGNNTNYMAASYCQDTTVQLAAGNMEKMFVPGNTELTFTLVVNADGSLTLSYATVVDVPEVPEGYNTVTIHFLKPSNWGSKINAWVWDANGAIRPHGPAAQFLPMRTRLAGMIWSSPLHSLRHSTSSSTTAPARPQT